MRKVKKENKNSIYQSCVWSDQEAEHIFAMMENLDNLALHLCKTPFKGVKRYGITATNRYGMVITITKFKKDKEREGYLKSDWQ